MTSGTPQTRGPWPVDEYLYFVDRAFAGMLSAVDRLGPERGNTAPPLPGANSPYAIVHHCVEVVDYWIGHLLAGRPTARDRDAEFHAIGDPRELRDRVAAQLRRVREDLAGVDLAAPPATAPPPEYRGPGRPLSGAGVLLHVLEELAQHHGQVEISRDLLGAS
ncbi:DinB family protein [Actinosynnema sp. NPDC053489]|uniref:DinB family protein n=1 Tax=Actinosynnema sp. NPDC053489 TaxID=3363916 RepID=UPI0037C6DEA7